MMRWTAGLTAFLLAFGVAWAQEGKKDDEKFRPEGKEEDELTPEQAMKMLKEAQELMLRSEELLNDSSRGKALDEEKEILKKLEELLKEDPSLAQKKALELIERMLKKTEKKQKDTIDKLGEIIKKAKS